MTNASVANCFGTVDGSGMPNAPRALIVVENAPVPADTRVWHESLSLRRAGWDVTVLSPHTWWDATQLPVDEVTEGVRIHRFPLQPAEENALGYVGEYAAAMWRIWREVRHLARERPFDVIQVCNPPDFLLLAVLGQRWRGAALIFDHHDLSPELYAARPGNSRFVIRALRALERVGLGLSEVVLVTNASLERLAIKRGGKAPEDVFVVRNGPMLEKFRPMPPDRSLARGRDHLLVYVGTMGPQDGLDHALAALSHLRNRRQDWHARFLGDGSMLPKMREFASQLGLDDHVEFCGFVSEEEVRRSISSADICLAPDPRNPYTDCSTLVKIVEYMALSRPTVSYDLRESRATAADAAVFATHNDPSEFAARIEELLDDPDRRRKLGALGRARVERHLAWEHAEQSLLAAYRRASEKRSSRNAGRVYPGESRSESRLI